MSPEAMADRSMLSLPSSRLRLGAVLTSTRVAKSGVEPERDGGMHHRCSWDKPWVLYKGGRWTKTRHTHMLHRSQTSTAAGFAFLHSSACALHLRPWPHMACSSPHRRGPCTLAQEPGRRAGAPMPSPRGSVLTSRETAASAVMATLPCRPNSTLTSPYNSGTQLPLSHLLGAHTVKLDAMLAHGGAAGAARPARQAQQAQQVALQMAHSWPSPPAGPTLPSPHRHQDVAGDGQRGGAAGRPVHVRHAQAVGGDGLAE